MRTLIAGLLLAVSCGSYADVKENTGNKLLTLCGDRGICMMYLQGFSEGMMLFPSLAGIPAETNLSDVYGYCIPKGVSNEQVTDVFIKYLKDNPAERHKPAAILALLSLRAAFPCPKAQ
jgi:hypothetical protein